MRLFHYTTREAAENILSSHELWFTRSDCFEDEGEFVFFNEIVKAAVAELFDDQEAAPWVLKHHFASCDRGRDNKEEGHVLCSPDILRLNNNRGFVLSASANADNGYLQKTYCNSDSTKMALVIDSNALIECIRSMKRREIGVFVGSVIYGKEDASEIVVRAIEGEMGCYRDCLAAHDPNLREMAAENMNRNLEYMLEKTKPFVKREQYREEEEVRVLMSLPDELGFEAETRDGSVAIRVFRDDEKRWRAALRMSEEWFSRVVVGVVKPEEGMLDSFSCGTSYPWQALTE